MVQPWDKLRTPPPVTQTRYPLSPGQWFTSRGWAVELGPLERQPINPTLGIVVKPGLGSDVLVSSDLTFLNSRAGNQRVVMPSAQSMREFALFLLACCDQVEGNNGG